MNRTALPARAVRPLLWLLLPILVAVGTVLGAAPSQAAPTCSATFTRSSWPGGATVTVKVTNLLPVQSTGYRLVVSHVSSVSVKAAWNVTRVDLGLGPELDVFDSIPALGSVPPGGVASAGLQLRTSTGTGDPTLTGIACGMYPVSGQRA